MVKNPSAMWETWVGSLGQKDALEKGMATHCSILAWRIPWTEEPGGLQSLGWQRVKNASAQHSIATPSLLTKQAQISGTILKSTLKMPCSVVDFLAQKDLRSPAQVGCMRQVLGPGALGRPRGIRWRGRWEGGSGSGIHVTPWLTHVNV